MSIDPVTIIRIDADTYQVARVTLRRRPNGAWGAHAPGEDLPLFVGHDLEHILELAAQAVTMFSPADESLEDENLIAGVVYAEDGYEDEPLTPGFRVKVTTSSEIEENPYEGTDCDLGHNAAGQYHTHECQI